MRRGAAIGFGFLVGWAWGAAPAMAQKPEPGAVVPVGEHLLAWLGLETGDTLLYEREGGERFCVEVGRPRELGGRPWAALRGLPWPGLASDSQVLLPLDGTLDLGVIRTPGPRPRASELLELPGAELLPYDIPPHVDPLRGLPDGWHAIGDPADPRALLYTWCGACMDAGTRIRLEKGRGITRVDTITIAGAERLTLVEGACSPSAGVQFQVGIEPAPPRTP